MLFRLLVPLAALALAAPTRPPPTAFLQYWEVERLLAADAALECESTVFHPGRRAKTQTTAVALTDALEVVTAHAEAGARYDISSARELPDKRHVTIAAEHEFHAEDIRRLTSADPAHTISIMLLGMSTPAERLCLEMMAVQKHFSVAIPFYTSTSSKLTQQLNQTEIESLFGIAFIMPPSRRVIELFSDKLAFDAFMRDVGMGGLVPVVYPSADAASYPCLVKKTTGMFGKGITLVSTPRELRAAVDELRGDPYLLQQAIPGPIEYAVIFLASHGSLLSAICGYVV